MISLDCKVCGGTAQAVASSAICSYCGAETTVPAPQDERKADLFNRANYRRRRYEFDAALRTYELLIREDDLDPEAHWGAVISRYGVEYIIGAGDDGAA